MIADEYHINQGGAYMERCEDCGTQLRQIGQDIYYCDDCDKIVTISEELMAE